MTVGELKQILEDYNEDLPVCIGMIQTHGSNFAMEIDTVDCQTVDDWEYGEKEKIVLTEGGQIGSVPTILMDFEEVITKGEKRIK